MTVVQPPVERGLDHLVNLENQLRGVYAELCNQRIPAEFRPLVFTKGEPRQMDDVGAGCLSYAIYNPTAFKVFAAFAGGSATPNGGAFEVPAKKLVVVPMAVAPNIELGVDPAEVKEASALIWRARFHTVQPFFVGALV